MSDPNPQRIHQQRARTGVLLVNLGTPDAPTASSIRRYLREFLSDRRVVELPRPLWLSLLYLFILPFRPYKLVHAYSKVWTEQGSPLLAISRAQQAALQTALGDRALVGLAMTYGEPSIASALQQFEHDGVRRLMVLPLYPQYSGTTTAAVNDAVFRVLGEQRWMPDLRTLGSYHDHAPYIDALACSIEAHWAQQGRGDHLLMSFHSIPRRYLEAGDPYFCQCHKTARLLAARLGLGADQWSVSFQSRLGRQPWLQPYTDIVLPELARKGLRTLDLVCPGFSADCLETLEEVAIRYAEDFQTAGGEALRYIPALNATPDHVQMLAGLCREHLQGWPGNAASPQDATDIESRLQRVDAVSVSMKPGYIGAIGRDD
ncbi:MAG: ferrochelatase [Panacagrimonas sp.]